MLIKLLRALGSADFAIKVTYIVMLGSIGSYMFFESLQGLRKGKFAQVAAVKKPSIYARLVASLPGKTEFKRSGVELSVIVPLFLGVLVGALAAVMGVGGGFIMVPVMVYLLRMPMHVVVGTSLFQILFTCMNVTILQASVNHTVDPILAILLLVGSVVGAQLGAAASRRLRADQLKILMAIIVLVVMVKMLAGMLVKPEIMLSYRGGH